MLKECKKQFSGVRFWLDRAAGHPEMFKKESLAIIHDGGRPPDSLAKESAALRGLEVIDQHRIYADVKENVILCEKIEDFCNNFMR